MAIPFARGWAIVAFTFVVQFCVIGSSYYSFGVFLKPLSESLGATRFNVSVALTLQMAVMGLLAPFVGRWFAERSIRLLMSGGVLLLSLGFALMSFATELWQLYVAFGVIASAGSALAGPIPNNTLLANWFAAKRGTAIGISQFGLTISGTLLVPVVAWLVQEYGWQRAVQTLAVGLPVLLLPLIAWQAVKRPEDVGLHPDGAAHAAPQSAADPQGAWTVWRALQDSRVLLLTLIVAPSFMAIGAIVLSLYAHATDLGFGHVRAGGLVATTTLFGAFAKPLFGAVADYFNTKWVIATAIVVQVLGVVLLLIATGYYGVLAGGALFGLGYGAMSPLWSVLLAEIFGRDAFSRVMGAMSPLMLPFNIAGFPFANWVYGSTGSYLPAFAALLLGYLVSVIALVFLRGHKT